MLLARRLPCHEGRRTSRTCYCTSAAQNGGTRLPSVWAGLGDGKKEFTSLAVPNPYLSTEAGQVHDIG